MLISQTNTAGTLYFLPDAQGSTRALAKADGSLGQTYDYDAFGNLQGDYQSGLDTNYLYTGQQFDVISELYSLRARYYDTSIGRFLSRDTWAYDYQNPVELNRYVYTANNPATYVDPSGYNFNIGGYTLSALVKPVVYTFGVGLALGIGYAVWLLMKVIDFPDEWSPAREIDHDPPLKGSGSSGGDNGNNDNGNNGNGNNGWDITKVGAAIGTLIGTGTVLCALLCPLLNREPKPEPTPQAVTPTPTAQPTPTSTPTERSPFIVRHYTTESAYASITSTGRYIFDASKTTDRGCKGQYCLFFARGDATFPMDEAGLKFFGLSSDYAQHQFHPVMIWLRYAVGNRSFEEVRNNEDLWPKCFIELDRNKVLPENMWSYRNLGQPNEEHIYGTNSSIVDVTDAVVRSGSVSALDPNPALPQVPSSSCSGGIKRAS